MEVGPAVGGGGGTGMSTQQKAVPLYPLHSAHPRPFRELTKSGCHNRVAPSSPTVTTRSSDPGCPADKAQRLSQKKGRSMGEREGRGLTIPYLAGAPRQLHSG